MPFKKRALKVSTHSRAEAAAPFGACPCSAGKVSTHSRAEAAAPLSRPNSFLGVMFQHTAARRRLPFFNKGLKNFVLVSTHSRAEAAALNHSTDIAFSLVSTHSRAEAAANDVDSAVSEEAFQHTAARRRLHIRVPSIDTFKSFNTQPRGGGC